MPTVIATTDINAPLDQVYALGRDVEAYPDFMPDVLDVEILEQRPDGFQRTRWLAYVRDFKRIIRWTEDERWDDASHTCTFGQTVGDFSVYAGMWRFEEAATGTHLVLELEYEYDVPLIGKLIEAVLTAKMQENCDKMLAAIKAEAEKA